MSTEQQHYDELCAYTLSQGGLSFIHQHVVDAFAAQNFQEGDKPIRLVFALVGLYLHVDRQFTGRQVQLAHMKLGRHKRQWPVLSLPGDRGSITAGNVLSAPPGPERERMIDQWCVSVWEAFGESHAIVTDLVREHLAIS